MKDIISKYDNAVFNMGYIFFKRGEVPKVPSREIIAQAKKQLEELEKLTEEYLEAKKQEKKRLDGEDPKRQVFFMRYDYDVCLNCYRFVYFETEAEAQDFKTRIKCGFTIEKKTIRSSAYKELFKRNDGVKERLLQKYEKRQKH